MTWQAAVERTVSGMNYELVELDRSGGGLVRVYIDRRIGHVYPTGASDTITLADCEAVTRQLHHVLEVEDCAYERLEVSSPGLDRRLHHAADFERFAGAQIALTLKLPCQGRKKYSGVLHARAGGWRLVFEDDKHSEQALDFTLEEVREARLVPVLDFKGRRARQGEAAPAAAAPAHGNGGRNG